MASFQDLVVTGLLQAGNVTATLTEARGINLQTPHVQPTLIATGTHHLVLPEFDRSGGPMLFTATGDAGAVISGVSEVDVTEYPVIGCLLAIICGNAAESISTAADDSTSPAGLRFSAEVEIFAGTAALFIYAPLADPSVRANYFWVPVAPAHVGGP